MTYATNYRGLTYNQRTRTLKFCGKMLIQLQANSDAQHQILMGFKDEAYDTFIYNPIWDESKDKDNNRSLTQKTVSMLNRKSRDISFSTWDNGLFVSFVIPDAVKEIRPPKPKRKRTIDDE